MNKKYIFLHSCWPYLNFSLYPYLLFLCLLSCPCCVSLWHKLNRHVHIHILHKKSHQHETYKSQPYSNQTFPIKIQHYFNHWHNLVFHFKNQETKEYGVSKSTKPMLLTLVHETTQLPHPIQPPQTSQSPAPPHSTFVPQHLHQAKPNSSIDTIFNGVVWEERTLIMVLFAEGHYADTTLWSRI